MDGWTDWTDAYQNVFLIIAPTCHISMNVTDKDGIKSLGTTGPLFKITAVYRKYNK